MNSVINYLFEPRNIVWIGLILILVFGYQYLRLFIIIMRGRKAQAKIHEAFQTILFDKLAPTFPNTSIDELRFLLEFFHIMPNERDPQGIMDVIERNSRTAKQLMRAEVDKLLPGLEYTQRIKHAQLLSIASELLFLYKIFRHYLKLGWYSFMFPYQAVELRKMFLEYKDAFLGAYDAFEREMMIGDSVGPLIVTELANQYSDEIEWMLDHDIYYSHYDNITFARAMEFTTGDLTEFLRTVSYYNKIITVDAALKLLGEETGSIAKAVGVACGGTGVERRFMEHLGIETVAFVVKMWITEAYGPMATDGTSEMIVDHRGMIKRCKDWIMRKELVPANILKNKELLIKKIKEEIDNFDGTVMVLGIGNAIGAGID